MVSIIIPIFNQYKHLCQCINSCLAQSYKDIELILINDASTDDSRIICQNYCTKDKRIRLFDKPKNEGVEIARYEGYKMAHGKYILFVDSDDWLCDKNIIEKMVNYADETNSDYIECNCQRTIDKWNIISHSQKRDSLIILDQPDLFDEYYISFFGKSLLNVNMWGKLYLKTSLDKVDLSPLGLKIWEDHAFNLRLFPHINRICIIPDIGYSYRWGGVTTRYNPQFYPNSKQMFLYRENLIDQYNYNKASDYLNIEMKNVLISNIAMLISYSRKKEPEIIEWITNELNDDMYQRICSLSLDSIEQQDEMYHIKTKNAKALYNLGKMQSTNSTKLRLLKTAIYKLCNLF